MRELNVIEIEQVNGGEMEWDTIEWESILWETGKGALTGGGPIAAWTRRLGAPGAIITGGIVGAYYGYEEVMRQIR